MIYRIKRFGWIKKNHRDLFTVIKCVVYEFTHTYLHIPTSLFTI